MNQKETPMKWSKSSRDIFEKFAAELEVYSRTQAPVTSGDQDVRYYLELQQQRLADRKLKLQYEFTPRGLFPEKSLMDKKWSDDRYMNRMQCRTCRLTRTFIRDEKIIYKKGRNENLYETITYAQKKDAVGEEPYTCPNCGAVSKVKELQEGCAYCGTYFKMEDLFPKVTNFFLLKDDFRTEKELKSEIFKFIIPCGAILTVGFIPYHLFQGETLIPAFINGILGGCLGGVIIGYLGWVIFKLGSQFSGCGRSLDMMINSAGSQKRFLNTMKQYSPEFSYEYFSNKMVSFVKMIVYAQNAQELPNYVGKPLGKLFSDIVESSYSGAVALKQCQVKDRYIYITTDVYMEDLYDINGHIEKRNDTFRLYLVKRIDKPVNFNFSIKKIQCKGCSGSFDATKQRTCPFCGSQYEIEEDDWIVTDIEKR